MQLSATNAIAVFEDKNVGSNKTVFIAGLSLTGFDRINYTLAQPTITTASIAPAVLMVTAQNTNRVYGAPNPPFTAEYSGFAAGENLQNSGVTGSPHLSTEAGPSSLTGMYAIVANQGTLSALNYTFDFGTGTLTIFRATCTAAVSSAPNPSVYGQPVAFTASLAARVPSTDIPTGVVEFYRKKPGGYMGTATIATNGTATLVFAELDASAYPKVHVSCEGDSNFNDCESGDHRHTVLKADTVTTLSSSANPSIFGETVTFTAEVVPVPPGGGVPSGTVKFIDGTTVLGANTLDSFGRTTFSATGLTGGVHYLSAVYETSQNYLASTSPVLTQIVMRATAMLTLSSSANPSTYGETLTLTATATSPNGTPVGTVIFSDGTNLLGESELDTGGVARFMTNRLSVAGSPHALRASYTGNGNFEPCNSEAWLQAILPTTLHVTARGVNRIYNGDLEAEVLLEDDRLPGDAIELTYARATFANKHAGTGKLVTVEGITLGGPDSANYLLSTTTAETTADIYPRSLTVSVSAENKIYDGTTAAAVTLADDRLPGDNLVLGYMAAEFVSKDAGTNKRVVATGLEIPGPDAGNYQVPPTADGWADILPAVLSVVANDTNRVYGALNPEFTATFTGFVASEDLETSGVTGSPAFYTPATPQSPAGVYPIVPSRHTLTAVNYTFQFVDGTLTVFPGEVVKLQILVPGEQPAPGTPSGKTGHPVRQVTRMPFVVTINAVDEGWNVAACDDVICLRCTDTNAEFESDVQLQGGTRQIRVKLAKPGSAVVNVSDVTKPGIAPAAPKFQ